MTSDYMDGASSWRNLVIRSCLRMVIWPETKITLNQPQRYKLQSTGGVLRRRDIPYSKNFEISEPLKIFF